MEPRGAALSLLYGLLLLAASAGTAQAQTQAPDDTDWALGLQLRFGGRYDNVRMCVATPAGVPGGPAGDVAFFMTFPMGETWEVTTTIPVFRPILFGAKFQMLQFEPQVSFAKRFERGGPDFLLGPVAGVSFHYGPGYTSDASGAGREPSFFAMGPILGAYAGVDFDRSDANKPFNFQLGITPYLAPLIAAEDGKSGIVAGGMLDALLRFSP